MAAGWKQGAIVQMLPDIYAQLCMENIPQQSAPFPPGYKAKGLSGLIKTDWAEMVIGQGVRYGTWHPNGHHQATLAQTALSDYSSEEKWNNRVAWHLGNVARGVQVSSFDGVAYAASFTTGHIAQMIRITSDPVRFPDYVYARVPTSNTCWMPESTEDGNRVWLSWTLASAEQNREMLGITLGYIETWQLGGTLVPVSILRGIDTDGTDAISKLLALGGKSLANEEDTSTTTTTTTTTTRS